MLKHKNQYKLKKLVVFSGAGMSAESGISTFRDANGLWSNFAIEDVATPEAWNKNPALVQSFYNQRRREIIAAQPNKAHTIIAELEQRFDVSVITQNIDDLHERSGSSQVLHLHGNIRYAKSSGPNKEKKYYLIEGSELDIEKDFCVDHFPLRPHVVWFGEDVPMYEEVIPVIQSADIFIVIGTSLNVYPAAGLINYCNSSAQKFIIDPKADGFKGLNDYTYLSLGAEEGMEELIKILNA